MTQHLTIPFMKMHGLGNDFVVIDTRSGDTLMTAELARAMGDRHRGVGFDQLAVLSDDAGADLELTFYNSDGSTAGACGNATRCVAQYEMNRLGASELRIRTERGILQAHAVEDGRIRVNMGAPLLDWRDVPLAESVDTLELPIEGAPSATGMGNPHCTFFVPDLSQVDVQNMGAAHEHHPLFPERTNVQIAKVIDRTHVRARVWERGVGVTLASGSSACAIAVSAARRGLTERAVAVELDGGVLDIDWREDGVWMTGPTAHVFDGVWFTT